MVLRSVCVYEYIYYARVCLCVASYRTHIARTKITKMQDRHEASKRARMCSHATASRQIWTLHACAHVACSPGRDALCVSVYMYGSSINIRASGVSVDDDQRDRLRAEGVGTANWKRGIKGTAPIL